MEIAVLSNVNMDLLNKKLSKKNNVYKPDGYGTWISDLVNEESTLYRFNADAIFILLDGEELFRNQDCMEEIGKQIDIITGYIEQSVKKHDKINYFISNIDIPLKKIKSIKNIREERLIENYWYESMCRLNEIHGNFYIFEMKELIENMGRNHFYSTKSWYIAGMKVSIEALESIQQRINYILNSLQGKKKKCLVLDMDNTLWGGVVGEVGVEGIELSEFKEGARYKDFQKRIKEINNLGIILAINSKNNEDDALEVLKIHDNMVLKEEDFVVKKINWKIKTENIKEIAEELNIGLDSFVFIDDNPFEQELIREQVSQVVVPEYPKDTCELEKFITDIYYKYFYTLKTTEEDRKKTKLYKDNIERNNELKAAKSFDDYIKSLEMKIKIWQATNKDTSRISQLTQKTNQFNVTTRRYSETDIYNFIMSEQYKVYIASVEDKFGDNGKVVVVILHRKNNKIMEIDTFLMSCRVMGRFVEEYIIDFIERSLVEEGFEELNSYYIPTKKNKPVENIFEKLGYELFEQDKENNKKYTKKLKFLKKESKEKLAELIMI